jgi:hypothetical protein
VSAPPSLGHGIRIGTGTVEEIKNPNSVMKGITEIGPSAGHFGRPGMGNPSREGFCH